MRVQHRRRQLCEYKISGALLQQVILNERVTFIYKTNVLLPKPENNNREDKWRLWVGTRGSWFPQILETAGDMMLEVCDKDVF